MFDKRMNAGRRLASRDGPLHFVLSQPLGLHSHSLGIQQMFI